jgi:hypothetical protein
MSRVARPRRGLAVVDRRLASVREPDHHEAAAAEVSRFRQRHGQREADGHRRVDGVAALLQDRQPRLARVPLGGGDDAVPRTHGSPRGRLWRRVTDTTTTMTETGDHARGSIMNDE